MIGKVVPYTALDEERVITIGYSAQGRLLKEGANVVVLEPDVAKAFRDSAAVNAALRSLLVVARASRREGDVKGT